MYTVLAKKTLMPKKMLVMNILDILRKYTDVDHRLSQKEIVDILKNEYNMSADRKSVRRNILNLIDFGYDIEYKESLRMVPDRETGEPVESYILSDFYLVREFSDPELRLLIDSLQFSKYIPSSQRRELVEKLESLSNQYFRARMHICTMPDTASQNRQLFYTVEVLDEAISHGRQVSFTYNDFGVDKRLHPRLSSDGKPREYTVNPYQTASSNGRYYLICNYDQNDDVGNYRLDRITDIKLLDTPAKPMRSVKGLENGFDLPRHMAEHVYMFSGESETVTFRLKRYILSDVVDWFGSNVDFFDETEDEVSARVHVNLAAMRRWAMQYGGHVRVLSPQSLADEVREDLRAAAANYER